MTRAGVEKNSYLPCRRTYEDMDKSQGTRVVVCGGMRRIGFAGVEIMFPATALLLLLFLLLLDLSQS